MTKSRRQFAVSFAGVLSALTLGLGPALGLGLGLGSGNAQAFSSDRPVVLELFTSQGCSSCPPADRVLTELAKNDGVIALSYHVDYWDYIGWKDEHAIPASTERQRAYAARMDLRYVYTPQVVVDGVEHAVGSKVPDIQNCVAAVKDSPRASLALEDDGETVAVALPAELEGKPLALTLVTYRPWSESRIQRGENRGKALGYTNSVLSVDQLAAIDSDRKRFQLPKLSHPGAVVLLQGPNHGPIYGALKLR